MDNSEQQKQKQKQKDTWLIGEKGEPKAHHLTSPIPSPITSGQSLTQPNLTSPITATGNSSGHQPNPNTIQPNQSSNSTQPNSYLLTMSDKDRQMVASNWLLNKELRAKLEIKLLELKIKDFRSLISKETGLVYWGRDSYFITWLDALEGTGDYVRLSFRRGKLAGECLNYCVVKSSNWQK